MSQDASSSSDGGGKSNPFGPAVGNVVGTYSVEENTAGKGTLYVASRALCFQSKNFLGIETSRLVLPWKILSDVTLSSSSSDVVTVRSGRAGVAETVHEFRTLADRDEVFGMITDAHTKFGGAVVSNEAKEDASKQTKRSDSFFSHDDIDEMAKTVHRSNVQNRRPLHRSISDPIGSIGISTENHEEMEDDYMAACTIAAMSEFRNLSAVMKSRRKLLSDIDEEVTLSQSPTSKKTEGGGPPADTSLAWRELRDSEEPSFNETACKNFEVSCDLETFFDTFLRDDAPQSVANYQRDIVGDTDFNTSPWALSDDAFTQEREIKYTHPVNAPMAPPSARATKKQRLQRFGEHGLCLETQTVVDDVPYTDCFVVDDRLLVEPRPEGGICLNIRFEIRFCKRTMFEKIITNTTRGEFMKFWKGYAEWTRDTLQGDGGTAIVAPPKVIVQIQPMSPEVKWTLIMFGIVLVLSHAFSILQMQSFQRTIVSLEEELVQNHEEIKKLSHLCSAHTHTMKAD